MNKKILFTTAIMLPSLAVGGLWVYQAHLFENSISHQVSQLQETLKDYGVSFRYDGLRVSPYLFQAHLVNPTISGTVPKSIESLKGLADPEILQALQGLEGTVVVKGEMTACFSPIANTVTITTGGDTHLSVQGPLEFTITVPKFKEGSFVIQRKDYDLFGKNSFLSLHNIKGFYSTSKEISFLLNDQKLFEIKDIYSQVSTGRKGEIFDISITSDINQMQFFKVEKGIKGKVETLDTFNTSFLGELGMQAALGPQDQKISASFHLNDLDAYINDIKQIFADVPDKVNSQVFEKLIPEGIRLDIKNYSTENRVYQTSMKGSFGKSNGYFPIKLSLDFKVTDQWPEYWGNYFQSMLSNLVDVELPAELLSILKDRDVPTKCMPQLQSFGKILFSVDLNIPTTLSLTEGNGSLEFKSDLYELAATGTLDKEGGSIKLKTHNATSLMADLENYVTRVAQPFSQIYPLEAQSIKSFIKGGQAILDKILEPSAAAQQSVHIKLTKEGIKIGNYDLAQILVLFGEAVAPIGTLKEILKDSAENTSLPGVAS